MKTAEAIVNGTLWGALAVSGLLVYFHEAEQMATARAQLTNQRLLYESCIDDHNIDCFEAAEQRYSDSRAFAIGGVILMAGGIGRAIRLAVEGLQESMN